MKKALVLVLVAALFIVSNVHAKDDSLLIRRAYIDTIGVIPTIEEIEWYCVYNTNKSYEVAVDYLINNKNCKINMPPRLLQILLYSSQYKDQPKVLLSTHQIVKNLFYVTGMGDITDYSTDNFNKASFRLIDNALKYSGDDISEAIDYMANCLMSRSTNINEINILLKIYKSSVLDEREALQEVLNTLMTFEDVIMY